MKCLTFCLMLIALVSCGDDTTRPRDREAGEVVVYIQWLGHGIPGKQVDIVETGDSKVTNEMGLAIFDLPVGPYTVRAYNINRGGPCCDHVDEKVAVLSDRTTHVEILDCLPCVAPDWLENN